jgi:hypothetical protein
LWFFSFCSWLPAQAVEVVVPAVTMSKIHHRQKPIAFYSLLTIWACTALIGNFPSFPSCRPSMCSFRIENDEIVSFAKNELVRCNRRHGVPDD